jgi:hypothetical protein
MEFRKYAFSGSTGHSLHSEKPRDVFINPTEIEYSEKRPLIKLKLLKDLIL